MVIFADHLAREVPPVPRQATGPPPQAPKFTLQLQPIIRVIPTSAS